MAKYFEFTSEQVKVEEYKNNNRKALVVYDKSEPIATLTVNVPEEPLESYEVLIKDYSENEGVLNDLVQMAIVSTPLETVRVGHAEVHKCILLKGGF